MAPRAGSARKYTGRSATRGWSEETFTATLSGVGTPWEATCSFTLTVTRPLAGTGRTSDGTATGVPASLDPWNDSVAVAALDPGFCRVMYSTKPGRTVPSAK